MLNSAFSARPAGVMLLEVTQSITGRRVADAGGVHISTYLH